MKEQIFKQQRQIFQEKQKTIPAQQSQIKKYFQLLNFSTLSQQQQIKEKNRLQQILKNHGFFIRQQFKSQIQIIYCDGTKSYQIVQIDVQIGHLVKTITILNTLQNSKIHNQNPINCGAFGSIYQQQFNLTYVIKCIQLSTKISSYQVDKQKIFQSFQCIFQQYFFSQLLSILNIGPSTLKPFGFDIIIYNECAQFFLEKCCLPIQDDLNILEKDLSKMHILGIIHGDIKPQNIMYSKSYKKNVFIDFGLTKMIKQKIGFKTLTRFSGSLRYSSMQMKQSFLKSTAFYIDLFYNDAICLKNSIQQLKKQLNIKKKLNVEFQQYLESNFQPYFQPKFQQIRRQQKKKQYFVIYSKYLLYKRKREDLKTIFQQFKSNGNQQIAQLYIFLQELPFDQFLSDFIYNIFVNSEKQTEELIQLQKKIKNNIFCLNCQKQENKYWRDLYNFKHKRINLNQKKKNQIQVRQLKNILLSESSAKFDFEYYCQCYLKFVSFTSNLYNALIQDKIKASDIFIAKLKLKNQFQNLTVKGQTLKIKSEQALKKKSEQALKTKNQLQSIYLCFKYIEDYILEGQFTKWKRNNLINLYINKCILGLAYNPKQMAKIQKKILFQIDSAYLTALFVFQTISIKQFDNNRIALPHNCYQNEDEKIDYIPQYSNSYILVDRIKNRLKSSDVSMQQERFLNLIVKLCPDIFNLEKKEQDSKQMLQKLQEMYSQINRNQFQNLQLYLKCHQLLVIFIIRLHYNLVSGEGKIKKLLDQIQGIYSNFNQFNCVDFTILRTLFNCKNYGKLKKYLIKIDEAVNCQSLSNRFCVSKRLALYVNQENEIKIKQIIQNFLSIEFNQFCPFIQFRQCLLLYQNLIYYKHFKPFGKQKILAQFKPYFEKCLSLIQYMSQNKSLMSKKQKISQYKQLIIISLWICFSIKNTSLQKFLYEELNWIATNKQHLNMKYQIIIQKANYLQRGGNISEAIQLIEIFFEQNAQNLKNHQNEQNILKLRWLCLHFKLKKQQTFQSFDQLQKIYMQLKQTKNASFFYRTFAFSKQACKMLIFKNQYQSLVQFFQLLSQYLSENNSAFNSQFLIKLINHGVNAIPNKNMNQFAQFTYKFQILKKLRVNPNFILLLHSILNKSYMFLSVKNFQKLIYYISKNLNRIKMYAKQTVLQTFYLILSKKNSNSKKKKYFMKKHLKFYTYNNFNIQLVIKTLRSQNIKQKWPDNIHFMTLQKIQNYFMRRTNQNQLLN